MNFKKFKTGKIRNKKAGIEINKILVFLLAVFTVIIVAFSFPILDKAKTGNDFAIPCGQGSYSNVASNGLITCNQCPSEPKCDIYQSKNQCEQDSCKAGCKFENDKCVKVS